MGASLAPKPCLSLPIKRNAPPCLKPSCTSASLALRSGIPSSTFSRKDRGRTVWSCRRTAVQRRTSLSLYAGRGLSSRNISPSVVSYKRVRSLMAEDFPEPLTPTITHSRPGVIVNETSESAFFSVSGYVSKRNMPTTHISKCPSQPTRRMLT